MLKIEVLLVLAGTFGYVRVGGSCTSERNIIFSDELIRNLKVECSLKNVNSCEFDGSIDYDPGIIPYRDRCYELDGQIFWYDAYRECTDDFTGVENKYFWLNLPICLGKSCSFDDLRTIQENEWIPNIIQDNLPDMCYVSYENDPSSPLSGTCAAENVVLDDALEGTWPVWSVPEASGSTYDFQYVSNDYKTTCLNSGGVLYAVEEVLVECNVFRNGTLSPYTTTLLNDAFCFGQSCSASDVQEYIGNYSDPVIANDIQDNDVRYSSCTLNSGIATKVVASSAAKSAATAVPVAVQVLLLFSAFHVFM